MRGDKNKAFIAVLVIILLMATPTLARPKVALVLGGGAARGFSHIGLIQAFEENGVPIDLLVGTSMGSIVASLYASGYSTENMAQIVSNMDVGSLFELPFPPKGGLLPTERFQVYMDNLLRSKTFGELEIPFYSVITELRTGKELALNHGPVSRGVQASMSIPALFPPVKIDGKYYVDGGMKNAVPVDVARRLGADVVIGVDVKKDLEEVDYDSILTNIQLTLWYMIDGYVHQHEHEADVMITPEVKYDSYMEYSRSEYFIEKGYEAGVKAMSAIKSSVRDRDPGFEFEPYKKPGLETSVVSERIAEATKAAQSVPKQFTIMPALRSYVNPGFNPGVGVIAANGPLGNWNLGYLYEFVGPAGGPAHEGIVGYALPDNFSFELYFGAHIGPEGAFAGLRLNKTCFDDTQLSLVYETTGPLNWKLAVKDDTIVYLGRIQAGSTVQLWQSRSVGGEEQPVRYRMSPELKLWILEQPVSLMEFAMVQPYAYAVLDFEKRLDKIDGEAVYHAGLGASSQLFGLYPMDVRIGTKGTENGDIALEVGFSL